jgi:hypothetical protein
MSAFGPKQTWAVALQRSASGCPERQKKKNFVISVNSARASLPEASPYLGALSVQLDMFKIEAQSLPAGMRYCDEVVSKRTSVPLRAAPRVLVWHESNIDPQQTVHHREADALSREQPKADMRLFQAMSDASDQPHVKNVDLIQDATSTRAGVTGFNMHHALPLAIVLLIGLYALASFFFD